MNKVTFKLLNSKLIKNIIESPIVNDHMSDLFYLKFLTDEVVNSLDKKDLESIIYNIHDDSIKFLLLTKDSIYNKIKYYTSIDIVFNEQSYYFKLISFLESKGAYPCISTFLKDITDEELVTELLLSIKFHRLLFGKVRELSDYNKIKFFDLVDDKYKIYLINLLKDDTIKIRYLNRFSFFDRVNIICNLNNDIYKVKYLKNSDYYEYKKQILNSFVNENIIFNLFFKIDNKKDKIDFIINIKNPNIKYRLYKSITDLSSDEKLLIYYNILSSFNEREIESELFSLVKDSIKEDIKVRKK